MRLKIGIIGGSGFYNMDSLINTSETELETPFGHPSDTLLTGEIEGVEVVVLARHGRNHTISPGEVNYRANICAMRALNVTHILASTACGSLKEEHKPGDLIVLDSFIDRTTKRTQTFCDQAKNLYGSVCHIPMHPTFCERTRNLVHMVGTRLGFNIKPRGTAVCIEGPRFSTLAESNLFRSWGADIVNMTLVPEAVLAKEAGISYCSVAMVTDYDCWKRDEGPVNVDKVMSTMAKNVSNLKKLFRAAVPEMAKVDWLTTIAENERTAKAAIM